MSIVNRFGTLVVDVVKPTGVGLPTASSLVAIPPPLAAPATDDFQCYRVRPPRARRASCRCRASPRGPLRVVHRRRAQAEAPVRTREPAWQRPRRADAPRVPLACYQVKQTSSPKFAKVTPVYAGNDFGGETLDVKAPSEPACRR